MKLLYHIVAIILSAIHVSSQHNPLKDPYICGLPICKGNGKFKYGPDIQQNYKYSVEVRSLFNGTSKNESGLYVEGTATLDFFTSCDGLLTLSGVKLSEDIPKDGSESPVHSNGQIFADMITAYSMRFSFKDGMIVEICPNEAEAEWVVNFKRGILSMLHNTMKRFDMDYSTDEEDVRGICPTTYKVIGAKETSLIIEKTKNLDGCLTRSKFHFTIQSTSVPMFQSNIKKDNILSSVSQCTLSIDNSIYKEITCRESYLLQPFSNRSEGASASIIQKLILLNEEKFSISNDKQEITKRVPLTFDHAISSKPTHDDLSTSKELIKQFCKQNKENDRMEWSDLFSKFIHSLRLLSYQALTELYGQVGAICPTGKLHLLDAIPFVSSPASVGLMTDIIIREALPESIVNEWVISMRFIANPNEEMMEVLLKLMQEKQFTPSIALSVSILTHTYCIQHSNCKTINAVYGIVQFLENHFLELYRTNDIDRNTQDNMMVTLKALSNIGVLTEVFREELIKIIQNSNLDIAIRLAAIETFRRFPCQDIRSYFESIFLNQSEDTEVRIASYLHIMRCPTYLLIRTIRDSLQNEEVNQVGSFVWTHLKNLIKSSVTSKVEIQSLLSEKDLVKKFSSDVRKFSCNFEGSLYLDEYHVGGNYESNVIYSPSSYIPKSAMLNLTVDLFGESVNLLEINGRADGFKQYLESFFGPKGMSKTLKDNLMDKLRLQRSVSNNEIINRQVEELPNVMSNTSTDPKLSLGFKIFGNEVKYVTFNGDKEIREAIQNLNPVYHLKRILSGKEINYSKAAMFLDGKYVIPSGAGFPLSLAVTGSASINIRLHGSLESARLSKENELELDLTANIEPTVSLHVTGEMAVDALYASTGIKLKTNVYTDSAIQSFVKIRGTKLVTVKFGLPKKKNEIFVARSELLVKQHDVEEPQKGISSSRISQSICSWPVIEQTVGLKLCTQYNFVNVTKMENIPYFLVAGPAEFRYYIHKSDPTANIYLFEYKLAHRKDHNVVSITLDTPGSAVKRLVSANLTIDRQSQNITVLLQSSAGTVLARGMCKNTPQEKFIQLVIVINNKKQFEFGAALIRTRIRNGFSYKPASYLGVNGERVLKLTGAVELMSKKGIYQYTVDLKFETKRLNSKLYGYISGSGSSLEASLFNDYKFQHTKEQRVALKFGAANRSRKNMVIFVGFFSLNSSAYSNMNFAANATFQKSGSHMDLTIKVHQNPLTKNHPQADFHTLKFDLLLSYKTFTDGKRSFNAVTSLSRKYSDLNIMGELIYETFRHDFYIAAFVKYGKSKGVSTSIFWSNPRSTLEQIKTHVNITIPSFTPMVIKLEISEKITNDYLINFHGTWFSGHTMAAVGFYQDKSGSKYSHHHIKVFLKSPSFSDFNMDWQFYHDNDVLKLDLKGLYDIKDDYEFLFVHQILSEEETNVLAKLKYKQNLHSFTSTVYSGDYKKIYAELRIHQIRDIVLSIHIYNKENVKSLGLDINWDANRDPNQKLMITVNYKKQAAFDYISNLIFSYPGRKIIANYKFLLERGHLDTLASIAWDDGKTLSIDLDILYEYETKLFVEIASQLHTPFQNWKIVNLDGTFEHLNNKYDLQGVVSWNKHQKVALVIFGDYTSNDSYFSCKYSCSITSSFDRIPNINTTVCHIQNSTNFDSNLHLLYNPDFGIHVDSQWKIDLDHTFTNLTGTIISATPFKGFNNGLLVSKIVTKNNNYIRGAAQVDLDHKKMDVDMEGNFKMISNCMLIVNVTSPYEKYQLRFVISTEKRQLVAMVTHPNGNIGTDILILVNSITNFDVKLHLATPVEFLRNVVVVAKLKPEEADFRLGWNFLLLGFTGVWHYANITDFEYSYKIYTPIKDFEENGIVGKLIVKEGLDSEFSIRLSTYKLGVKLLGHPQTKPLKKIGIKIKNSYLGSKLSKEDETYGEDLFSWAGLIEVDAISYSTMKGEVEIDQKGASYIVQSKLTMPHGVAVLFDEFEFVDVLMMKNILKISTPYESFKSVASNFELNLVAKQKYFFRLNLDYENRTKLVQTGVYAKYTVETKDSEERIYNVTFKVNTPFKAFPKLNLFGILETEENFYHTKLLLNTNRSDVSLDATSEIENGLLEITSMFHVITPSIYLPPCQLRMSKLFSLANNYLEVNLNVPDRLQSDVFFRLTWLIASQSQFRVFLQLESPFTGMENTTAGVDVSISKAGSTVWTSLQMNPLEVAINSSLKDNIFTVISDLNFNGKRYPLFVDCKILKLSNNKRNFNGNLKLKGDIFIITGNADLTGKVPSRVFLMFSPEDKSAPVTFEYQLRPISLGRYDFVGDIKRADKFANFNANFTTTDTFNWELNLKVDTSNSENFIVDTKAKSDATNVKFVVNADTPIEKLEHPKLCATYWISGLKNNFNVFFEANNAKGNATLSIVWDFLEDMYLKGIGHFENPYYSSQSSLKAFYENPQQSFYYLKGGGDIQFDKLWQAASNFSLRIPPDNNMGLEGHLKLPDEPKETHSIFANLFFTDHFTFIDYLLRYRTSYSLSRYGLWGNVSMEDKRNLTGNIEVEWNGKRFNNYANLKRSEEILDLIYKLKSPKFTDRQLLVTEIKYKSLGDHHNLTCEALFPEDRSVAFATVDYKELANMNGMFNTTIPHKAVRYFGTYFETQTTAFVYNRYIKVFWDGNNALLDNKCDIKTGPTGLDRNTKGKLIVELPLTTRHIGLIDYEYDKNSQISLGNAKVNYNGSKIMDAKYNCVSESKAGLDKDKIHIQLENKLMPVGADYIYTHKYDAPKNGYTAPTANRFLHLYHLENQSTFSVKGELNIRTTWSGEEYVLTAIHSNKTVKLLTKYDVLDKKYKQHSRLELSPSNWIEYDISILNRTKDEVFDAQQIVIDVVYPKRSFTAQGFYNISKSIVSTDVSLVWDKDNKTIQAGLDWKRSILHREEFMFQIKHPSFERDVSFYSVYGYNKSSIDAELVVDYSLNPDQKLTLGGIVKDNSNSLTYNYTYNIWAEHNATNLNLDSTGDFYWNFNALGTEHITNYQRSYLPLSTSEKLARINMDQNEIELKKYSIATGNSYFWGRYIGNYPIYTANMSATYGTNDTDGKIFVDFSEKLLYLNLNLSEDGSQSFHVYGVIPDARSSAFDIWRDYEDKKVSDVSYYLKLNHSRLIMSRLLWRPELISDLQEGLRTAVTQLYTDTLDEINNTKQYMKAETLDAINGIWTDARPLVENFLTDMKNLTVIENDIEDLKRFLNASYYANDFYIRDVITVVLTMFDDLALKSHLQSLPKIVQEIWSVLGESGQKIKKSILWVVEKVKTYYKNATEFIHGLINGDPIELLSIGIDRLVEKYDGFIKKFHVSIIRYMEELYSQIYTAFVEQWHKSLADIEPTFIKLMHYLESMLWNTGKELLDFLYQRKNEIIESPYFAKLAKLSHDLDKFFKDVTGDNTIASLYKYAQTTWTFLKEKYLNLIPFGKELIDILNEIMTELKQIGNIPTVKYLIERWYETYEYARYYYNYFDMETKLHKIIRLIYVKLSDMSVTALESENRKRVAKTKFIFEPNDGIMLFEQKLPMSWHAFDEVPKFKEIPEIKKILDLYDYLEATQISFWNLYYDYQQFSNPSVWLPPFKGYAMLVGYKHYITFDKRYYDFRGNCTYLLATDFVDRNFTLLVSYDDTGKSNELMLILNKTIVRINLFNDRVIIGDSKIEALPAQIGDAFLYQNEASFTVSSDLGFTLECNMKYYICTFEISGWYFGKTAGLLGTYNNEPSDDFLTSNKRKATNSTLNIFGDSWALNKNCKTKLSKKEKPRSVSQKILSLCEDFFTSKVSQLSTCFPRVPKDSFLSMCLNSTSEQEACMAAVSYIKMCSYANAPLRIPDTCVKCNLLNGTGLKEGDFARLQGNSVPQTADIVFIVEAKKCNKDLRYSKNLEVVIELLEKELVGMNIKKNRYALVVFGGDGVFDEPRSIIINGKIFANSKSILQYFDSIPTGNGNGDIFKGIIFAFNLIFRPGVSRNFVLVPCSKCNKNNMEYDYSTIHQTLSESAITLHILMNDHFAIQKETEGKEPFGIDRRYAYTKKDVKGLVGDQPLRKLIILPKSTLGLCLSLAVETNGTVFSGKFLGTDKKNAKKFSTVFAKLVARAATPKRCIDCECTALNSGVSYMECYLCMMTNSTRTNFEILGWEDDDSYSGMNMFDGFHF